MELCVLQDKLSGEQFIVAVKYERVVLACGPVTVNELQDHTLEELELTSEDVDWINERLENFDVCACLVMQST